jgi:hypothetical protein
MDFKSHGDHMLSPNLRLRFVSRPRPKKSVRKCYVFRCDFRPTASFFTCPIPCTHFLFPYAYLLDVFLRASLAQTLFVSDCTPNRDYPLSCFLSETYFIVEDAPHHLIITLPSCTLCVFPLSCIFLSRFTMITPPMIKPQIDSLSCLTFFRRY